MLHNLSTVDVGVDYSPKAEHMNIRPLQYGSRRACVFAQAQSHHDEPLERAQNHTQIKVPTISYHRCLGESGVAHPCLAVGMVENWECGGGGPRARPRKLGGGRVAARVARLFPQSEKRISKAVAMEARVAAQHMHQQH